MPPEVSPLLVMRIVVMLLADIVTVRKTMSALTPKAGIC
jgi:hypothetical protein